jgi:hypothetical protein
MKTQTKKVEAKKVVSKIDNAQLQKQCDELLANFYNKLKAGITQKEKDKAIELLYDDSIKLLVTKSMQTFTKGKGEKITKKIIDNLVRKARDIEEKNFAVKQKLFSKAHIDILKKTAAGLYYRPGDVREIDEKGYKNLLETSLQYINRNKATEFPLKDLVKLDEQHLKQFAGFITGDKNSTQKDLILADFIITTLKNDAQESPLKNELTLRFLDEVYPYDESKYGTPECVNKELRNKEIGIDLSNLLEPAYSTAAIRMQYIKDIGLTDKYVQFLQKQIQDIVFKNDLGEDYTIEQSLLEFWGDEDSHKFSGLVPSKVAKKKSKAKIRTKEDLAYIEILKKAFGKRFNTNLNY